MIDHVRSCHGANAALVDGWADLGLRSLGARRIQGLGEIELFTAFAAAVAAGDSNAASARGPA